MKDLCLGLLLMAAWPFYVLARWLRPRKKEFGETRPGAWNT